MDTNTDPVRAHDELRVQAALLRTPDFMAQFDPDKFAGQLERIATALAPLQAENERLRAEVDALTARLGYIYRIAGAAIQIADAMLNAREDRND